MSETILRILASELQILRLVCIKCGSAIELPITVEPLTYCPSCKAEFIDQKNRHLEKAFERLVHALGDLKHVTGRCRVEFIVQPPKET